MQVRFVDGSKVNSDDNIAAYYSNRISRLSNTSSLKEESEIVFSINGGNYIYFTSKRRFFRACSNVNNISKEVVEEGSIKLAWGIRSLKVCNSTKLTDDKKYKYNYLISLPEGYIYLSSKAFQELMATIENFYRDFILQKSEALQELALALEKSYEQKKVAQEDAIKNQWEKKFQTALNLLAELEAPWKEFPDTYEKIKKFTKVQALSVFIDIDRLSEFENDFNEKWVSNSVDRYKTTFVFQTRQDHFNGRRIAAVDKIPKFDVLVRLVSNACLWEESYAAVRTYGAILSTIKEEAKSECNVLYNYFILDDWKYEDCLREFVSCVKDNYKDPVCFGCFVYYLMAENKIPLPPKYERTHYNLGFEFAYNKTKQDIMPYVKEFFDNLEVLQLERELASDDGATVIAVEGLDLMSGQEFEQAVAEIFKNMGYKVSDTPVTGDQGVDIIAVRNGIRIGIQAKCYAGKVGNSAVQEVVAGKHYYNLNRCMVVTNSTFTSAAVELAKANNVTLWDRKVLQEKLLSYNSQDV